VEFWAAHTPSEEAWSRQYRSAIFVADAEERRVAERSVAMTAKRLGRPVHTAVEERGTFWQAEDYHQKYRLKRKGVVWGELAAIYPDVDDLVMSTAAARANAWASNFGSTEQRARELPETGLSYGAQLLLR